MGQMQVHCSGVQKTFGGLYAVNNVSVSFKSGMITALIGPNGAGKTTLFHIIAGTLHADGGTIHLNEIEITRLPPWRIARLGVGRLFQDVRVFARSTVIDNIMVAFQQQLGENPLWAILRRRVVNSQEQSLREKAMYWLEYVGLAHLAMARAQDLSYGQQKLLAIARLLAADMEVLLLDEPTAGVNPEDDPISPVCYQISRKGREDDRCYRA